MKSRLARLAERAAYLAVFGLVVFVAGVQVGIAHGRWLAAREQTRPVSVASFVDTSCLDELGRIRLRVVATGYSSTSDQTDGDPWITATGNRVRPGTVAVSRDLLGMLPHGTALWIIDDTMGPAARDGLDVWFPSRGEALRWGRRMLTLEIGR